MFGQFSGKVESLNHLKGSNTLDQMMNIEAIDQPEPQKPLWCEKKQAAIHDEIRRMSQLPANSTYVTHRVKVLNKILQLMSIQNCITGAGVGVAFFRSFSVKNYYWQWLLCWCCAAVLDLGGRKIKKTLLYNLYVLAFSNAIWSLSQLSLTDN